MAPPSRRPPLAPAPSTGNTSARGAKAAAPSAPAVRPKKLYRAKEERPAVGIKAAAAAKGKGQTEEVSRKSLQVAAGLGGLTAFACEVPLEKLSRKELQAKAIKAGLKANAKSADLIKALAQMESSAAEGAAIMLDTAAVARGGPKPESAELDSLKALGILGKTPGGGQWRHRPKFRYNTRSAAATDKATGDADVIAEFKI